MSNELNATNFASLACDIAEATKAYKEAEQTTNRARSHEVNALNVLNAAQKAFDAAVVEWKKAAPRDSGWAPTRVGEA